MAIRHIYSRPCQIEGDAQFKNVYILDAASMHPKLNKNNASNNRRVDVGNEVVVSHYGYLLEVTSQGNIAFPCNWVRAYYKRIGILAICKPPDASKMTSPTRNGAQYTVKWAAFNTKDDNAHRPTGINVEWSVNYKSSGKTTHKRSVAANATSDTLDIIRNAYYPMTSIKVKSLSASVKAWNLSSNYSNGVARPVTTTYSFKTPRKPSITGWSFNKSNGELSVKIKTNAGTDQYERYDTRYIVTIRNPNGTTGQKHNTSSNATEINITHDFSGYQGMSYSQYTSMTVEAWSRGIAGDSEHVKKTYVISYPNAAAISSTNVSGKGPSDKVTLAIKTNATTNHPVDQVKLQYLANVEYEKASDIPGGAEWVDSGIVDDAQCDALSMSVQDLIPEAGKHSWLRVKTWRTNEAILYRYTKPVRLDKLFNPAPTAQDETVRVVSAEQGDDATRLLVQLVWNRNNQDDATGTELSWSPNKRAWKSTEGPKTHLFTWAEGRKVVDGTTYYSSAKIEVTDLEENKPVYICARRYLENGDEVSWSHYSNMLSALPGKSVDSVTAMADRFVPKGSPLMVSWSFSSPELQAQWKIIKRVNNTSTTVIASGKGPRTSYQIPAARLESVSDNGSVTFLVSVSIGSTWCDSTEKEVTIVEAPELAMSAPATLVVQPLSLSFECNKDADVRLIVTSDGVNGETPFGIKRQAEGDVLFTELLHPEWNSGEYSFVLPEGLDFIDGGSYTVSAVAIDEYGLESEEASAKVEVDWAHKAVPPICEIQGEDVADEYTHHQRANITLSPSENIGQNDTYEIYRLTGDGATLIASGLSQDAQVSDEYAPFGAQSYRIVTRTPDGDWSSQDFPYYLPSSTLRFDWDGNYLELPYDLSVSDAYSKDVEIRDHMDGTQDAYWNDSISRKGKLGSTLVNVEQEDDIAKARQLARYTGPVFVRTPNGSAYTADVQVTDLSASNGLFATMQIEANEIDITEAFTIPEEEEEGE